VISPAAINRIIPFCFLASLIFFVHASIPSYPTCGKTTREGSSAKERYDRVIQEGNTDEFCTLKLPSRQIFRPVSSERGVKRAGERIVFSPDKEISLVGIILGEDPQAIIEDKRTQKIFYVKKGQFIEEFKLEDIEFGKAILSYKDRKFEIHL
jgi:hypothetical protein